MSHPLRVLRREEFVSTSGELVIIEVMSDGSRRRRSVPGVTPTPKAEPALPAADLAIFGQIADAPEKETYRRPRDELLRAPAEPPARVVSTRSARGRARRA